MKNQATLDKFSVLIFKRNCAISVNNSIGTIDDR